MYTQLGNLIQAASAVRKQANAPYSGFALGAAVRCKSGAVFVGSNIENIPYGLTICAERIAVVRALAVGEREFVVIAVVTDTSEPIAACGVSGQFLAEFARELVIVNDTVRGGQKIENLSDLLPNPKRGILENAHNH